MTDIKGLLADSLIRDLVLDENIVEAIDSAAKVDPEPVPVEATVPDVLYVVRPGDNNEELRYSLRSVAKNLPHRKVWIAGYKPKWVTGVEYVPRDQPVSLGRRNAHENWRAGLSAEGMVESVVMMNDDFFVMRPVDRVLETYWKPMSEVKARSAWSKALIRMGEALVAEGYENPLCYDAHVPMLVDRARMLDTLDWAEELTLKVGGDTATPVFIRTAYGNRYGVGGKSESDGKNTDEYSTRTFISTADRAFRYNDIGRYIRRKFSAACEYEN